MTAARHRTFIASRLLGSVAALAAIPVYILVRGVPSGLEVLVLAWLVAPILIAFFLSQTGRYEVAHVLSSLALTGLVTVVAVETGGIVSFAAIWLVVVPLEAALSASRRVAAVASTFALVAAGLLLWLSASGLVPPPASQNFAALAAFGIVSAALYATGLALGAESLARTGMWLFHDEENRYRLLAQNMTDVITRHGRHGAVLFVSPAAGSLLGASIRSLHGHGLFDRVHVADRPAYLKALSDAAATGEAQSVEFRIRRDVPPDRARIEDAFVWVEMRCRPVEQANTDQVEPAEHEVVAVLRDITAHKNQELALEEARAEAERANAAKGRFLATMSHELRTPLNVIIGFSEMLTKEGPMMLDAERRQSYARMINESGNHLLAVVNGILDMSKIDSGNFEIAPEPFEADRAVATCCDLMALKAGEAGVEVVRCIDADLPEINADKRAFNQILLNLLSNALKFTERGGRVTVSARRDKDMLIIGIADTGVGIGADDLQYLGDPFFQARGSYDRRHDGTGLGISIVKGLVELHGGSVAIDSRLGAGTTVTVRLPVDCEPVRPRKDAVAAPRVVMLSPDRTGTPVRKIA